MLVWTNQRKKSPYVAFQAMQAMGYQMVFFWIGMAVGLIFMLLYICVIGPLLITLIEKAPNSPPYSVFLFEGGLMLLMFTGMGLYMIGGIYGAIRCFMNQDFRYPMLGRRLETYLSYNYSDGTLDETRESQFVVSMSHAAGVLMMWGVLTPLALWITQKERSPYLRFQSMQATVYQFLAILGYFAFTAIYFLFFIGFFGLMVIGGSATQFSAGSSFGAIALLIFVFVMLLMWVVFMFAVPTYHLFAMIAGIQTLKGRDYHYPLLGNFIARRMNSETPSKTGEE
jgi:uncharacterized Tic20 family protein